MIYAHYKIYLLSAFIYFTGALLCLVFAIYLTWKENRKPRDLVRWKLENGTVKRLFEVVKNEDGIETIEYALIAALIAIASIAAARWLGLEVSETFNYIATVLGGL